MRTSSKRIIFALLALIATSCSKQPTSPEDVYMAFWDAVDENDYEKAVSFTTLPHQETVAYIARKAPKLWNRYYFEVTNIEYTPEKDRAFLSVVMISRDDGDGTDWGEKITMIKTTDGWKIDELDL